MMGTTEFRDFINPYENPDRYLFGELGLGNFFADNFMSMLRYVSDANTWRYYEAGKWKDDAGMVQTRRCAKEIPEYLKGILPDEQKELVEELSKRSKREIMIKDAQDVHPLTMSDFDTNPYLFNCKNGVYDLETGQFREHDPGDFLSKQADVTYIEGVKFERWLEFINEITCGDSSLADYLRKSSAYCLSGKTDEECLFILYGPKARNGKSTYTESLCNLFGGYARTIQPATLAQRRNSGSGHSTDIARLAGIRLVNASELPSDMKLNAAMVKQLTGGDTVTARFLYQDAFEFLPQFKMFINTNHLPEIEDDTLFASGRLKLVPFDRHFDETEQDHGLKREFRTEEAKTGILNWLLEGYALYKKERLNPPKRAEDLLRDYRKSSDKVGLYIENRLVPCDVKAEKTTTLALYMDFLKWCAEESCDEISLKALIQKLRQKKLVARDGKLGNYVKGYKIRADKPDGNKDKDSKSSSSVIKSGK